MKTLPELIDIVESKGLAFETLADQANWINGFRTAEKIYTKGDGNCDSEKTPFSVKIGCCNKHESE